jgi:hypothetical protein
VTALGYVVVAVAVALVALVVGGRVALATWDDRRVAERLRRQRLAAAPARLDTYLPHRDDWYYERIDGPARWSP